MSPNSFNVFKWIIYIFSYKRELEILSERERLIEKHVQDFYKQKSQAEDGFGRADEADELDVSDHYKWVDEHDRELLRLEEQRSTIVSRKVEALRKKTETKVRFISKILIFFFKIFE